MNKNKESQVVKYADSAQREILKKLDKQLKAGKLDHVRDTPDYWKKFTSVELEYILNYRRDNASRKHL